MPATPLDVADFRLLRVFVAVVESGGFAAAEVTLNLSLSTISSHMKALETRLGLRLCNRGRAGFALTEAGQAVYTEARQLISASEGFSARVAGLRDRLAGPVRLGLLDATITDPQSRVSQSLAIYAKRAPQSEIRVFQRPPDELLKGVSGNDLDAAIGSFPRVALGLEYRKLYDERHYFYCGRDHPLFDVPDAQIDHDEIRRYRLVGRSYWGARDLKAFATFSVGAVVSEMEGEAALIRSGAFLGYLPEHYARIWTDRGEMRMLAPQKFTYVAPFHLVFRPDRLAVPRIAALVECLSAPYSRGRTQTASAQGQEDPAMRR